MLFEMNIESVKPQETRVEVIPLAVDEGPKPSSERYVFFLIWDCSGLVGVLGAFSAGKSDSSKSRCCGGNTEQHKSHS